MKTSTVLMIVVALGAVGFAFFAYSRSAHAADGGAPSYDQMVDAYAAHQRQLAAAMGVTWDTNQPPGFDWNTETPNYYVDAPDGSSAPVYGVGRTPV